MVLEELESVYQLRKHPFSMFLLAFLFTPVAIWVSFFIFPESSSLASLFFIVIPALHLFQQLLTTEEEEEVRKPLKTMTFLERHFDLIQIYSWFFIGLIIAFSFWYVILPTQGEQLCLSSGLCFDAPFRENIFEEQDKQLNAIQGIRNTISGQATGSPVNSSNFWDVTFFIFSNNATVLLLAIIFSFLFGAGSLFLIVWNASIIGTVMGKTAVATILSHPEQGTLIAVATGYLAGLLHGIGFVPHGIPEIVSYFIGAIAGGIISASIAKKQYRTNEFEIIAKDAFVLIIIAIVILFIAAVIETFVWGIV